jgi:hypothetical protein
VQERDHYGRVLAYLYAPDGQMTKRDHDPLDEEEQPIPGSPRSRIAMVVGIGFLIAIVVALFWFFATHTETREDGGGMLGYHEGSGCTPRAYRVGVCG